MTSKSFTDGPTNKLFLFDVDGTLTPARKGASPAMLELLAELKKKVTIGFVGGSDFTKISEQLSVDGKPAIDKFDYVSAENGLTAYKLGKQFPSQSFINHVGEDKYKVLVNFILQIWTFPSNGEAPPAGYFTSDALTVDRGTFVEFRKRMINVSPIGRNATIAERHEFEAYDKIHRVRAAFVKVLREKFTDYNLTHSIGGQISFDVFPTGWDKTHCLRHVEDEGFEEIHFFGDKTYQGGNDYEIFTDKRTIGHTVTSPEDTQRILKEMFWSG